MFLIVHSLKGISALCMFLGGGYRLWSQPLLWKYKISVPAEMCCFLTNRALKNGSPLLISGNEGFKHVKAKKKKSLNCKYRSSISKWALYFLQCAPRVSYRLFCTPASKQKPPCLQEMQVKEAAKGLLSPTPPYQVLCCSPLSHAFVSSTLQNDFELIFKEDPTSITPNCLSWRSKYYSNSTAISQLLLLQKAALILLGWQVAAQPCTGHTHSPSFCLFHASRMTAAELSPQ